MNGTRQNVPLLAVLVAGVLTAVSVVMWAAVRSSAPGPQDVALSVDGVDVTFEQLRMWQDVKAAIDALEAQVVAGEIDVDLPPDVIRSLGAYQEIDRALRADVGPHLNAVAGAAVEAAAYAAAEREGVLPTAEQVNAEVELILSSYETSPAFSGFLERAQAEALGEAQYREWLPRHRAEVLARLNLSRLPAYGPGIMGPVAYDLALNAEIGVHPSLGVTEEELRAQLRRTRDLLAAIAVLLENERNSAAKASED